MKNEKISPNILFLGCYSDSEILIGPEKVANRIFNNINKKYKSTFIEYFFDGSKYGYIKKFFGKEIISENDKNILRLGIFRILLTMFKIKPEIIHIITFERFAVLAFLYKMFSNVKIIFNIHGIAKYENKYIRDVKGFENFKDKISEFLFMKFSSSLLFLSEDSVSLAGKYYKIKNKKVRIICNGVDESFYYESFNRHFNDINNLSLVFIADIDRKDKGFDFLKTTLEQIKFELNLFIICSKSGYNISFDNKNIKFHISGLMNPEQLASFLKDKDIFISASNFDSFGISAVEATATGIVPILTKETGASRFIKDGENGFIIDYGDANHLLEILNYIRNNPEIRNAISSKSNLIYNILSWDNIAEMYENIYKNIFEK